MTFESTQRILWKILVGLWVIAIALIVVAVVLLIRSGT